MKELLKTTLTLAALAASLPCQLREAAPRERLSYARVIEKSEGDLARAEQVYRDLLADPEARDVHDAASFELGRLLWTLGKRDEARTLLARVKQAGGEFAARADQLLQREQASGQEAAAREQKAEALVGRMQEILSRYVPGQKISDSDYQLLRPLEDELSWLAADAARVLARAVAVDETIARDAARLRARDPELSHLCSVLWRIGTEPARDHLIDVADNQPMPLVRLVASQASGRGEGLVAAIAAFARRNDPTGEVWRSLAGRLSALDVYDVLTLTSEDDQDAQALGMHLASRDWHRYNDSAREVFLSMHEHKLRQLLQAPARRARNAAQDLLTALVGSGPQSGTKLFLELAHTLTESTTFRFHHRPGGFRVDADDAWIAAAARCAERLGPMPLSSPATSKNGPSAGLFGMLEGMTIAWTAAAHDDLIRLFELGYVEDDARWLTELIREVSDEQAARMIRALPGLEKVRQTVRALAARDVPASWYEPCRAVVQRCLEDASIRWRGRVGGGRVQWRNEVVDLIRLAAHARPGQAASWIGEVAAAQPMLRPSCCEVLVMLSRDGVQESRASLRAFLRPQSNATDLAMLFAAWQELLRAGDEASIPMLAESYGYASATESQTPRTKATEGPLVFALCGDDVGFDEAQQRRLWNALASGPHRDQVWHDLTHRLHTRTMVPVAGLPALSQLLRTDPAMRYQEYQSRGSHLLKSFEQLQPADAAADHHSRSISQLMNTGVPKLVLATFARLHPEIASSYRDQALAALRAAPGFVDVPAFAARVELDDEAWRLLLRVHAGAALRALPDDRVADFEREVAACLGSTSKWVQAAAADVLVRGLGQAAAPWLLPLLRDEDEAARELARTKLDDLRTIREQQQYWSEDGPRVDTTPAGAAAKLIAQAMPDQPKAQRLLAIRSLALLGEPVALPYLIDWIGDGDGEVQAAARAAITELHQSGAANRSGKSGGK
ncbi:MAG: HEAT repeat domain-containing protein [Planctomycetes bacterium]|nr:HEAT repeat domain-containing protein [Planctomycetota bacterium]